MNQFLLSDKWECVSKDEIVSSANCFSSKGETFSFTTDETNKVENQIFDFLKKIGINQEIIAKTPLGTVLKGKTLGKGKILAKISYADGSSYEGELEGIYFHGKGKFISKEFNYIYEGDFLQGRETGKGKKIDFDDSSIAEGDFLDGYADGSIVLRNDKWGPNSDKQYLYEGQVRAGKKNGMGKETIISSSKLTGVGIEVSEDRQGFYVSSIFNNTPASKSGQISINDSILSISDRRKKQLDVDKLNLEEVINLIRGKKGNSVKLELKDALSSEIKVVKLIREELEIRSKFFYEGMFIEDDKEGFGKATYEDGSFYEGSWRRNLWHGFGKRTWGQGQTYFGSYKDGNCEGTGIQLNAKYEIVYYGGFLNCLAHGYGGSIAEAADGSKIIKSGNFENNRLNGYGEAIYPEGISYKGYWVNDQWKGQGEAYFPEFKETHIGIWESSFNRLDGEGSLLKPDFQYFGEFKNNQPHGTGVVRFKEVNSEGESYWGEEKHARYEVNLLDEYFEPKSVIKEKRIAMIIGNSAYMSSRLESSLDDSYGMAATLEELGFRVIHKTNLKQKSFREAIWEFSEYISLLGKDTTALFYYAGHAVQLENQNYLIPIDSRMNNQKEIELEAINAELVLNALNKASLGTKILILDACRNNPFKSISRSYSGGLAQMSAPVGTFIAYSTAPGSVALDITSSGYGVYTGNLINNIKAQGITIEEVFKRTRSDVVRQTQNTQVPWDSSSLIGDFYFKK